MDFFRLNALIISLKHSFSIVAFINDCKYWKTRGNESRIIFILRAFNRGTKLIAFICYNLERKKTIRNT